MTELLTSSCTFNLQEARTYNIFKLYETSLVNYNPCNEYLEHKSFYQQDNESSIKIVKLSKLHQGRNLEEIKIKKIGLNKKRKLQGLSENRKSLSFNSQK